MILLLGTLFGVLAAVSVALLLLADIRQRPTDDTDEVQP